MTKKYKACKIEKCEGNALAGGSARGWCTMHYQRWRRCGDAEHVDIIRGAPMAFLNEALSHHSSDDCLLWPFSKDSKGYGQVWFNGALHGAHRVVCIKASGEPPTSEHQAAHSCGNGHLGCINPNHLRWDTRSGNLADRSAHGTLPFGQAHSSAKLTDEDIRSIKVLAKTEMQKDIAELFSVSRPTVSAILSGKRWAHIT